MFSSTVSSSADRRLVVSTETCIALSVKKNDVCTRLIQSVSYKRVKWINEIKECVLYMLCIVYLTVQFER